MCKLLRKYKTCILKISQQHPFLNICSSATETRIFPTHLVKYINYTIIRHMFGKIQRARRWQAYRFLFVCSTSLISCLFMSSCNNCHNYPRAIVPDPHTFAQPVTRIFILSTQTLRNYLIFSLIFDVYFM